MLTTRSRRVGLVALCAAAGLVLAACGKGAGSQAAGPSGPPAAGGSLTVLENSGYVGAWPGFDPATNASDAADAVYMDAIYGDLFEQSASNQPVPDLATGYHFSTDGKTLTITLRKGVTFSDGTPFDAAAVKFNIERDISPVNSDACGCSANFPIASIATPDDATVVLHLSRVSGSIMGAFFGAAPNWIASPTALAKLGEKPFSVTPVGAGPFVVQSDKLSSQLVLKRNPHYWRQGRPYLDSLTFSTIGSDESAYEALVAGQAQVYQNLGTFSLVATAKKTMTVTSAPLTQPEVIQLNTKVPPFNNPMARQALYYATDPNSINKALTTGLGVVTQSMTGPNGLFYTPKIPGYRTYDLAKAKTLVRQLGGLKVDLATIGLLLPQQVTQALKSQWARAGIQTTIDSQNLQSLIQSFKSDDWQAQLQTAGGFDPALGFGLSFRYLSTGPFSGVTDPALDGAINAAVGTLDQSTRATLYRKVFQIISDKAYSPFLFVPPTYNVSAPGVQGPGLTRMAPQVQWENVAAK